MIVFEGPDGAGKTTLMEELTSQLQIPKAPRASTSEGGPVENLFQWAWNDVRSWGSTSFVQAYDRHPLVSEYIYGPICRGYTDPAFDSFHAHKLRKYFQHLSFVIFCLPPLDEVTKNVQAAPQMPGVESNISRIYKGYQETIFRWEGAFVIYDYTAVNADLVKGSIIQLIQDWINIREEVMPC